MSLGLLFAFISMPLVGFLLMLFFGLRGHRAEKEPYDILSYFPYELFKASRGHYYPYARLGEGIFLLGSLALPSYLISRYLAYGEPTLSFVIGLLVFSIIGALATLFSSVVSLSDAKGHLLLAITSALLDVLVTSMEGYLLFASAASSASSGVAYAFAAVLWVFALLILLPYFNPKLGDWAKLDKEAGEDGSLTLKRPRPFVLAFSEWLTLLTFLLATMVSAVAFYLI